MTALAKPWLQSYAPGVPAEIAEPSGSLVDIIRTSAAAYPQAVALEFFGAETTYAELSDQIDRAAEALRQLGVRHGDPVALVLPNCPQHIAAFYAILRLGGIVIEHNPLYTPRELRHQFEDHGAKAVIAWDRVVETIQDFPDDLRPGAIVSVDVTKGMPALTRAMLRLPVKQARESRAALTSGTVGTTTWERVLGHAPILDDVPTPFIDDIALLQYTSGTTGAPKAATLTHRNLVANAAQSRAWVPQIEPGPGCVVYAVLPMFHAYGLTLCLTFAMSMGGRLVLFPKFDPDLVLKVVKRRPPTFLPAVPPIIERLERAARDSGVSLRGARVAISGAMPLSTEIVEPWERASGGILVEGYGLSECSPVIAANPVAANRRIGTVGLPFPSTEVRTVSTDDPSQDVPSGQPGELVVRGPQVMGGYWRRPEETAAAFLPADDGGRPWYRTGDIATIAEDGFITIVDRIKELIITGGFNVSPSEVEETLRRHPSIADAAVVGLPHEHSGEQVVAAVVLAPGATLDEEAVREFVRGQLAAYKVPRRLVVVDELPKSLIGKVLRRQVRESLLASD